jgi:hypothetical protein
VPPATHEPEPLRAPAGDAPAIAERWRALAAIGPLALGYSFDAPGRPDAGVGVARSCCSRAVREHEMLAASACIAGGLPLSPDGTRRTFLAWDDWTRVIFEE